MTETSPGLWTFDFFYGLGMTQGYQLYHSLSDSLLKHLFDNVLPEHGGLPHILPLAYNLDFFELSVEVEGLIQSQFYSLSFFIRGFLQPSCLKVTEGVVGPIRI